MQIDEAEGILGTAWALAELSERKETHTKSNIVKILWNVRSDRAIDDYIDYLERFGAIKCKYVKRQGRHPVFQLFPERIPDEVVKKRIAPSTKSRWKTRLAESEIGQWVDGNAYLDPSQILNKADPSFLEKFTATLNRLDKRPTAYWQLNEAENLFIAILDGQKVEFPADTMEFFHTFICWKVKRLHSGTNV